MTPKAGDFPANGDDRKEPPPPPPPKPPVGIDCAAWPNDAPDRGAPKFGGPEKPDDEGGDEGCLANAFFPGAAANVAGVFAPLQKPPPVLDVEEALIEKALGMGAPVFAVLVTGALAGSEG